MCKECTELVNSLGKLNGHTLTVDIFKVVAKDTTVTDGEV